MICSDATRVEMVVSDEDFQRLIGCIGLLSHVQLAAVNAAIRDRSEAATAVDKAAEPPACGASVAAIEARFAAEPRCPQCQSAKVGKWGSANRLKRYRCKPCKITFNCLTGTPLAQLHKRELWGAHAQALVDGISLQRVADRIGVHVETAFRWRHRFMKAPKALKPKSLEGTVEADETYFLHSRKGARKLDRPARKRGGKAKKRGLSAEQVPVLIARDRNKATTDQILPDRSMPSIAAVLEPVVAKSAVLVTDGAGAGPFRAFANKAGIVHVGLNLSAGEHTWGIYHVQNVNNYCSRLKSWMRRFNGVATKYLDTYLGWQRTNDREGSTLNASGVLSAAWS